MQSSIFTSRKTIATYPKFYGCPIHLNPTPVWFPAQEDLDTTTLVSEPRPIDVAREQIREGNSRRPDTTTRRRPKVIATTFRPFQGRRKGIGLWSIRWLFATLDVRTFLLLTD